MKKLLKILNWKDYVLIVVNTGILLTRVYFEVALIDSIRIEDDAMYISNDCVFPSDWTAETLMQRHRSRPYNPNIANAFFRAGYVESWGRGIQKICESCEAYGTALPEYIVHSEDIMVKLSALPAESMVESTKIPNRQNGGLDGGLADKIILKLQDKPEITQKDLANEIGVPLRTIQRELKQLRDGGKIVRTGGKRYGHWEVQD